MHDLMEHILSGQEKPAPKKRKPIKATIEVTIDGSDFAKWKEFLFEYSDVFDSYHIGYWAYPVARHKQRGVLIVDVDDFESSYDDDRPEDQRERQNEIDKAFHAWRYGGKLPDHFYRIDRDVALGAYLEGVKEYGLEWQDHPNVDGHVIDSLVQHALFGEQRYG